MIGHSDLEDSSHKYENNLNIWLLSVSLELNYSK